MKETDLQAPKQLWHEDTRGGPRGLPRPSNNGMSFGNAVQEAANRVLHQSINALQARMGGLLPRPTYNSVPYQVPCRSAHDVSPFPCSMFVVEVELFFRVSSLHARVSSLPRTITVGSRVCHDARYHLGLSHLFPSPTIPHCHHLMMRHVCVGCRDLREVFRIQGLVQGPGDPCACFQ